MTEQIRIQNTFSPPQRRGPKAEAVQVIRYVDPEEGFSGFLAIDSGGHTLSAGGLRVQSGLTGARIADLARAMSFKQRLLGFSVGGAKCGIDYDPSHPGKAKALGRFLSFLRPYLRSRYSMGPDMGVTWGELEDAARAQGIKSVKMAIAAAQGLSEQEFLGRLALLGEVVGAGTLGRRRAGHGVGHAALAVLARQSVPAHEARIGLQGFGTLGWGAAHALAEAGVGLSAVADASCCLAPGHGIDLASLDGRDPAVSLASRTAEAVRPPRDLFKEPLDVLILAAVENALTLEEARSLDVRAVVCGANLALSEPVEQLLHERGVIVIPDFVAGCCGSASMDALFGPPARPAPQEVLRRSAQTIAALVETLLDRAQERGIRPRAAAVSMAEPVPAGEHRPYGAAQRSMSPSLSREVL